MQGETLKFHFLFDNPWTRKYIGHTKLKAAGFHIITQFVVSFRQLLSILSLWRRIWIFKKGTRT